MRKIPTQKAFTLIELLVVVSIIGMLSSLLFAGVQNTRNRATDTVRVNRIHDYDIAIQSYYLDKGSYPIGQDDSGVSNNGTDSSSIFPFIPELAAGGYMPVMPADSDENTILFVGTRNDTPFSPNRIERERWCGSAVLAKAVLVFTTNGLQNNPNFRQQINGVPLYSLCYY